MLWLGELTSIGTLFAFVLTSAGVIILRYRLPHAHRAFRVPGPPWLIPGLGVLTSGALMVTSTRDTWIRFIVWMALGLVIYLIYGYRHSKLRLHAPAGPTIENANETYMMQTVGPQSSSYRRMDSERV